jgi:hypothetical protein
MTSRCRPRWRCFGVLKGKLPQKLLAHPDVEARGFSQKNDIGVLPLNLDPDHILLLVPDPGIERHHPEFAETGWHILTARRQLTRMHVHPHAECQNACKYHSQRGDHPEAWQQECPAKRNDSDGEMQREMAQRIEIDEVAGEMLHADAGEANAHAQQAHQSADALCGRQHVPSFPRSPSCSSGQLLGHDERRDVAVAAATRSLTSNFQPVSCIKCYGSTVLAIHLKLQRLGTGKAGLYPMPDFFVCSRHHGRSCLP